MGKWAMNNGVTCYRLHDADMPEYAVAIDLYDDHVHVQGYQPPATVSPERARARLKQTLPALPEALGVSHNKVIFKVRERKWRAAQYERLNSKDR